LDEAAQNKLNPASYRGRLAITQPNRELTNSLARGTLIVGESVRVKGTIDGCDTLIVQGLIQSSFKTQSLLVLEGGEFVGTVEAENVDIAGIFDGELAVQGCLKVRPTGRLSGTFHYARISIDEGAEISGYLQVGGCLPPPLQWKKAKARSSAFNKPVESAEPPEFAHLDPGDGQTESLPIFQGPKLHGASFLHKIRPKIRARPDPLDSTGGET
jgi:cytoskeletal protein CcmA (bactofilin family)